MPFLITSSIRFSLFFKYQGISVCIICLERVDRRVQRQLQRDLAPRENISGVNILSPGIWSV